MSDLAVTADAAVNKAASCASTFGTALTDAFGRGRPGTVARCGLPPAEGRVVSRYAIVAPIGEGGMGTVYKAYDPQLGRSIAIKLLRPDRLRTDGRDDPRERLLREAQAMARLSHPNVVTVYEAGEFEGQVFVVMELVRGQTLRLWLKDAHTRAPRSSRSSARPGPRGGPRSPSTDFKPDNVLVGADVRPCRDFGLARASVLSPRYERATYPIGAMASIR